MDSASPAIDAARADRTSYTVISKRPFGYLFVGKEGSFPRRASVLKGFVRPRKGVVICLSPGSFVASNHGRRGESDDSEPTVRAEPADVGILEAASTPRAAAYAATKEIFRRQVMKRLSVLFLVGFILSIGAFAQSFGPEQEPGSAYGLSNSESPLLVQGVYDPNPAYSGAANEEGAGTWIGSVDSDSASLLPIIDDPSSGS
jgi:hypothetical protein